MGIGEKVERDVRSVAEYWGRRKREFIEEPALAFEQIVRPAIYFESEPDPVPVDDEGATSGMRLLDLAHDVFGVDGAYRTSVNMRQLV